MAPATVFSEYLSNYSPLVLFLAVAALFGAGTLVFSYLIHPRIYSSEKLSAYECGSEPISDARMPFPVRYYIIAMLFVIFDIEVIFIIPWAVRFQSLGLLGLVEMLVFITILLVGLWYAWKKGALEWD